MKILRFEPLPCIGPPLPKKTGTVIDLLEHMPYFLKSRVPTKVVLNDILNTGIDDGGMSGGVKWEPFQLADEEYREVREVLEKRGLVLVEPPGWVKFGSDWHIWEMDVDHGIPSDEHRKLN
jgi:hypothetical protein